MRRTLAAALVTIFVLVAVSLPVMAEENEKIQVLQKKFFTNSGKHELTPFFFTTMASSYTWSTGAGLSYTYHIIEPLAVQAEGIYMWNGETSLWDQLHKQGGYIDEPDRMRMNYYAGANVVWYPFYGKFDLFGYAAVNYNIYLLGGVGYVGTEVTRIGDKQKGGVDSEVKGGTIGGSVGGGIQFWALKWLDVKVEFRDFIYNAKGLNEAQDADMSKVRNNAVFILGVGFLL